MSKAAAQADTEESLLRLLPMSFEVNQVRVNFESCTPVNTRVLAMLSSAVKQPCHTQTRPNLDTQANAPGDGQKDRAPGDGKRGMRTRGTALFLTLLTLGSIKQSSTHTKVCFMKCASVISVYKRSYFERGFFNFNNSEIEIQGSI